MQKTVIFSIWEANRASDTYVHIQTHNYYELVYYSKGSGTACIDGHTYTYSPNTFFLIPPNVKHDEIRAEDSQILCLSFASDQVISEAIQYNDESKQIYKILKDILSESIHQNFNYQNMILSKLGELLVTISRIHNTNIGKSKNFQYIINYLKENYHEKIQLQDCAMQLHISYDYFQHKFKEITGLSPQQFLLEERLTAAKEMLMSDDLSCTEIAYRCGFSTSAQFSMLFKRRFHMSPLRFRATFS